ncbi:MAG: hypothetical protein KC933_22490 [Myxococcales bacterium]|nr:hypothetical protein [Myxococcales bacterium]MCB9646773.1 hypothetical protein [Deltaproteobacteria bacterium]
MKSTDPQAQLVEEAAGAHRPTREGRVDQSAAWRDLDADGREVAFELARRSRVLEAALDPDGYSTTVRAVLARLGQTG